MRLGNGELRQICERVIAAFRADKSLGKSIALHDYHGFQKTRIPSRILKSEYDDDLLQAELVEVTADLTHEVHRHAAAHAYCYILGEKEGFPDPTRGFAFMNDAWKRVQAGDIVDIPPGTAHGFTVTAGTLHFLSIQSPSIERAGHDDYEKLPPKPLSPK